MGYGACIFSQNKISKLSITIIARTFKPTKLCLNYYTRVSLLYSAQASYFAAFRGIRDTKIEKSRGIRDNIYL